MVQIAFQILTLLLPFMQSPAPPIRIGDVTVMPGDVAIGDPADGRRCVCGHCGDEERDDGEERDEPAHPPML